MFLGSREQNYRPEDCGICHAVLTGKKGHGFWEGGKGKRRNFVHSLYIRALACYARLLHILGVVLEPAKQAQGRNTEDRPPRHLQHGPSNSTVS